MFIIRDREAGNLIESFETLKEAKRTLEKFEQEDKEVGNYVPDFYEIYDTQKEEPC